MNPYLDQMKEKGYIVIPNVISEYLLNNLIKDILMVLKIPGVTADPMGMVELYHLQSLWDIRQHPKIHGIFSTIFETPKLWVSIDRICYKKPGDILFKDNSFIHWDVCVNQSPRPQPMDLQGVLALTDTDENMGGFQCVPSLYQELDEWLGSLPTKKAIFSYFNVMGDEAIEVVPFMFPKKEPKRWKIEKIPVKAGDLIIWDSFLPHGNHSNQGKEPRFAQYITMFPEGDDRLRCERIDCWKKSKPPSGYAFPGNSNIPLQEKPAELTSLGRKLLGIDKW